MAAFNATTGHNHDGTSANGGPITVVGPTQDLIISASSLLPKTNNTLDLGSGTFSFKDAYFEGDVVADAFVGNSFTGILVHPADSGYFTIGSYNIGTYGEANTAQLWHNPTLKELSFRTSDGNDLTVKSYAFSGLGTSLTALNATQLTTGTVPSARIAGAYTGITSVGALAAGSITTGFGNINIGTNSFTGNGSNLTALNASQLTSGTVNNSRLPSTISVSTITASGTITGNIIRGRLIHDPDQGYLNIYTYNTASYGDESYGRFSYRPDLSRLTFNTSSGTGTFSSPYLMGNGTSITDLNASELTTGNVHSNRVSGSYTGIVGVGTLNAGAISSGFGSINIGASTFTGNGSGITSINASNISSGTLSTNRLPNHSADLLTSGTLPMERLWTGSSMNDFVRTRYSGNSAGEIGMVSLMRQSGGSPNGPNDTLAGSSLYYASCGGVVTGGSASGTWRCMGRTLAGTSEDGTTLWMRIS